MRIERSPPRLDGRDASEGTFWKMSRDRTRLLKDIIIYYSKTLQTNIAKMTKESILQ